MANQDRVVIGGVDTHKDIHVAAVIDEQGRILETREFVTTAQGNRQLLTWMQRFGVLLKVGVEGTGSYGAGLARSLRDGAIEVVEVNRPNRQMRRRRGKSDTVDAEAAARAALNGEASVVPKAKDSLVDPERLNNEAAFAARCGVFPVQASSGKTQRHRLNRSGNRQANHALWRIALVRLNSEPRTKDYVARRTAEGKSRREIMRCLKRYIAREVFALPTMPKAVPIGHELRSLRMDGSITLQKASEALGTSISSISRLELGKTHDADLARRYRDWLRSAGEAA